MHGGQMEKFEFETKSFCFSPHRHLKSETYRTLVQILSHCYDHSQIPQDPSPEMCGRGELVGPNTVVLDDTGEAGIEDRGFGEAQIVLDEIEDVMQIEENGDNDKPLDQQQILMDELEHIMKGDEILDQENGISFSATSVGNALSGVDALKNDRREHVDFEQVVNEEPRSEAELQVDKGECNLDVPKSFDSSVNRIMDSQFSKPIEDSEEKNSKLRINKLEVENEMQQKEMEVENLVHTDGITGAHDYISEDVEFEEGEISSGFEHDKESIDMTFDDAVVANEKKEDEKQVSKDVTDKRGFPFNDKSRGTEIFSDSTSFNFNAVNHNISGGAVELKGTVRNETQSKSKTLAGGIAMMAIDADKYNSMPGAGRNKRKTSRDSEGIGSFSACFDDSTVHNEIIEQKVTEKQGNASKEKPDSGVCNKKKRSALSKERKAKKKQKERKKRAEKNRQLGVRRLKLPLNLKPKTVKYCLHYLKGRCQEGDKCKFSHDTVPLTKSTKACCHFARNSCMKGDNCPFDHELSKYPCDNFVAKRFCSRGDDCLFSHKITPKEEVPPASSICTTEPNPPPLPQASNLLKQLNSDQVSHQNVDALSRHGRVSSLKNKEQNVAKSVLKPPAVAPKGITCLFMGKSSELESSKLNQGSSSPKRSDAGKFTNQTEQIASGVVQNRDETLRRTPVASKGVNFLSFGNAPLANSSGQKLAKLFLNQENGAKSSLSTNFGLHENANLSTYRENSAEVGNATTQRFQTSVPKSNDMLKQTQSAITSQGLNLLSTGNAMGNNSISNKQASFHSSVGDVINRTLQDSQNTPITPQNSSAVPWRLSGSSLALGHSSDHLAQGYHRSTPNSAQKALAFASKIEPKVKINQSAGGSGVNNATRGSNIGGSSTVSYNDSANASKILDFLSRVSSKTKQ